MINVRFLLTFIIVSFSLLAVQNDTVPTLKELCLNKIDEAVDSAFEKELEENNGVVDQSLKALLVKIPVDLRDDIEKSYRKAKGYYVNPPFYLIVDFRWYPLMSQEVLVEGRECAQPMPSTFEQMMLKCALQFAVKKNDPQFKKMIFCSSIYKNLSELNKQQMQHYASIH